MTRIRPGGRKSRRQRALSEDQEKDQEEAKPEATEEQSPVAQAEQAAEGSEEAVAADAGAEEEEEKVEYQLLETLPKEGSVSHYKVSVPRQVYSERTDKLFKELSQNVTIEGFRRGKAPRKLLEIRYGKEITEDAARDLAANVTKQLIDAEKLTALGEPDLHEWTVEGDNPIELIIEIETQPKLAIAGYESGLEIEVEKREVTGEMVEKQLERIREGSAQFVTAPESAVFKKGDGALIDYEALDQNGAPLANMAREDCFERDLAAAVHPQLAAKLDGLKAGETVEAEIESTHQTRRGEERKTTDKHRLTLKEIKRRELPALDDEFAKDMGDFESLAALKDRIRKDLETQAERATRDETLAKICDKILEANPFEAPRSLTAYSTYQMLQGSEQRLAYMGLSFQSLGEDAQERYLESARAEAERNVKINLAVRAIAEAEKIEASDEDFEKAIEKMAEAEGRRPLAIRARLEREKRIDDMKSELLVDKVNDFLISKTKVTLVEPKPPEEKQDDAKEEKEESGKSE
jgi:trigger factor